MPRIDVNIFVHKFLYEKSNDVIHDQMGEKQDEQRRDMNRKLIKVNHDLKINKVPPIKVQFVYKSQLQRR